MDDKYASLIQQNIKTGNFKVAIVGDSIHPDVLGMIESIQSAPHLSFSIFLIELSTHVLDDTQLILCTECYTKQACCIISYQ